MYFDLWKNMNYITFAVQTILSVRTYFKLPLRRCARSRHTLASDSSSRFTACGDQRWRAFRTFLQASWRCPTQEGSWTVSQCSCQHYYVGLICIKMSSWWQIVPVTYSVITKRTIWFQAPWRCHCYVHHRRQHPIHFGITYCCREGHFGKKWPFICISILVQFHFISDVRHYNKR